MEEKKMALPPQQFCVRWNSYHTNLQTVFPRLLLTEQFADVTLACESRQLRCHKLVLSACSAYLERLLVQNPCKHPIVFMRDMRFSEMQALVDFMYKGEVNVTQSELPSLLKSAEALQIRGLCSGEGAAAAEGAPPSKDYTVATEALLAQAQRDADVSNGQPPQAHKSPPNGASPPAKKRKSSPPPPETKEETVEEDGLFYGELEAEHLHYEDEDSGKPGSSLGQPSARHSSPFIRVKPESELFFHNKLQSLAKNSSEYIEKLANMNPADLRHEFSKYGLNSDEMTKKQQNTENDYYKSWLEQNGELEVSLLKASDKLKKPKIEPKNTVSEVELIPKSKSLLEKSLNEATKMEVFHPQIRRRGRPPIFKDRNVDIGEAVLKSDLDQFLEGKEVSSSGLSRKDLERVMMGKFNPNRRYSNEAMWAALMDVKKGGSIYRAAQTHKVPRKSLRNWMKRCHIKSSFPMPQQLKQFVENSKRQKEFKNYDAFPTTEAKNPGSETEYGAFEPEIDFGKHFLSYDGSNQVSSEDEAQLGVRTSTEIVTRHFIDLPDHGIPLNIHARPRIVGRRPNAIVNIETDVFQEKSYKQYSSQHLRDALIAVKKGYSVYAASNKYGVPRKTLRNWMEKYDIKNFAIANVQCQYDSPSDTDDAGEGEAAVRAAIRDHTYDRPDEPPAFIIQQLNVGLQPQSYQPSPTPYMELTPKMLPRYMPAVNVIHLGEGRRPGEPPPLPAPEINMNMNRRIRRSEQTLRAAADCVSRGLTFQTVSERFNIPISTIRFFMARKGILPRRRRGRHGHLVRPSNSPEPPFHMQHYKLPDMVALKQDADDEPGCNP